MYPRVANQNATTDYLPRKILQATIFSTLP